MRVWVHGEAPAATVRVVFAFVVLALAGSWPAMKLMVTELGPAWLAAFRFQIAVIALLPVALVLVPLRWPARREWVVILAVGGLQIALFTFLIAAALTVLPAGRAVAIAFATPLWVAPGAALLLRERLATQAWFGVAVGLAGLGLLTVGGLTPMAVPAAPGGIALLLAASLAWAIAILITRRWAGGTACMAAVPWQLGLAAVPLTVAAALLEGPPPIPSAPGPIAAILYIGVVATALAFWGMLWLATRVSATSMAVGMLAVPLLALGFSAVFLAEPVTPDLVGGFGLILTGILLTLRSHRSQRPAASAQT